MIAEAVRDGEQVLCTMRTALAYTEGYLSGRDTVLTRARSEWLIEERPNDSDEEILSRVVRLVVCLNAARVGRDELRAAYDARDPKSGQRWFPTVTTGDLEPGPATLARAFGHSEDGYPLFPFNAAAIRQLCLLSTVNSRKQLVLNPRHVINGVISRVLKRRAFELGEFPSAQLTVRICCALIRSYWR